MRPPPTPPHAPLDLPDDFGNDDLKADGRIIAYLAGALAVTFVIAAVLILVVFA